MELWVRSQDRESLLKVEKMFYFNTCPEMESTGRNVILNKEWIGEKDCIELGEYATKERALEVLDEIQSILCFKRLESYSGEGIINIENNTALYLMPKE